MIYPVIMAGGKGTRFWPLSRESRPKQLLSIVGESTMIQETVERLKPLAAPKNILIVTGTLHADEIARQLPELPAKNIIAEPVGRNTAPCVALAALAVAQRNPDAIMAVFPADHVMLKPDALLSSIRKIETALAERPDHVATIGIVPSYPETGYGYIERGEALTDALYSVKRFCEKPAESVAKGYVDSGSFYWNSGMFFWKAATILDALREYMPDLMTAMAPLGDALKTGGLDEALKKIYPTLPAESIDYGVMEKLGSSGKVIVADCDPGWNDVGSWRSLYDLTEPDENNNRSRAPLFTLDASGVLAHTDKTIAVVGLSDIIVVEAEDALLILPKERAQDVRAITDQLKKANRIDLL